MSICLYYKKKKSSFLISCFVSIFWKKLVGASRICHRKLPSGTKELQLFTGLNKWYPYLQINGSQQRAHSCINTIVSHRCFWMFQSTAKTQTSQQLLLCVSVTSVGRANSESVSREVSDCKQLIHHTGNSLFLYLLPLCLSVCPPPNGSTQNVIP